MALSPQATILTLLWLTTRHGRLKALVLMLGEVASTAAALVVLVMIGRWIGHPVGRDRLTIAAGLVALGFGLACLGQVVQGLRRVTRGGETLGDLRRASGLAEAFEHASWAVIFEKGAKASVLDPRAPQSLVPAAFIIVLHPLRPAEELAVILAFAGVVGLGVAAVLAIALLPVRRGEAWLLAFRGWMERNGGAVVLGANALLAVVLFWKAFRYLA
jgi:hypothetical protein